MPPQPRLLPDTSVAKWLIPLGTFGRRALRVGMRQSVVLSTVHSATVQDRVTIGQTSAWAQTPGQDRTCDFHLRATTVDQVLGASAPQARYEKTFHSYVPRNRDVCWAHAISETAADSKASGLSM